MNCYKALLTLKSSLGTPLVADTFFGHICWAIALNEGEQQITEFLEAMSSENPPLLISDPLPKGYWPTPTIPYMNKEEKDDDKSNKCEKKFKLSWIPTDIFVQFLNEVSMKTLKNLSKQNSEELKLPNFLEASVPHVSVNRLTNHALELFFDRRIFPEITGEDFPQFEMWILSSFPKERVEELIESAIVGGYGKDASTGAGHLVLDEITDAELPQANSPNAVMTLSPAVPAENDPICGFWRNDVRFGKLGGPWATTGQEDETNNPFKHPLIMLQRGAVFLCDNPADKSFIGKMVPNIHPTRSEVKQYGYAITIPIYLSHELLGYLKDSEADNES